ncbi:MAG TPA: hypothetical protein VFL57_08135 [Bryobacteraceae bacterium]|nr:hypothetical protein [Bryobacteraceae bacterium]
MHRFLQRALILTAVAAGAHAADSLIQVDRRQLVSRADLVYDSPASRPEEGMPVGNGRMGSLIWTTPSALKLQINRVDVHAMDSSTVSFPRADSDYGYACGYVDINVVDAGEDVFTPAAFRQHLSLYDALITVRGKGLTARAIASPVRDVTAIEIEDLRDQPSAVNIELRMLCYQTQFHPRLAYELAQKHSVLFRTAEHTAESTLGVSDGRITLTQQFREGEFYGSSAVAIGITGRPSRARYLNQSTMQLSAHPGKGRFLILIASAASKSPADNTAAAALQQLAAAVPKGFEGLRGETAEWWSEFWSRGMVYMHSDSRQADFVESNYTYYLYLMGSSSRGDFPPRFGGLLWFTDGDMSRWGSQYWWANTYAYYSNLMPANRLELVEPMFRLYRGMYDAAALAARQQWDSKGIWIPETTFFNGPEKLPDDIAAELRDLMLVRKPFEKRSQRFDWYANTKNRHNSRWNFRADGNWEHGYYIFKPKGTGIFGHTSHILGVAARVGNLAWQRYQFTNDEIWLREGVYPIIRGAAEFYRSFPNFSKAEDGLYHINHTNSGESAWNSRDAPYEIACLHMIFPLAIRASEILGIDGELRPVWREIKEHLVPMPERGGRCGTGSEIADNRPYGAFVYNGPGAIEPVGPEPDLKSRFLGFTKLGSFIDAEGTGGAKIFRNRLRLREGPGAIDAEHLGGLSAGVHTTMLNSRPESTTAEAVTIFDRWPKDWNAAFRLLARGGFIVSSAQRNGSIPLVEIVSQIGGTFRLSNPWRQEADVYRNGGKAESVSGKVLVVATVKGETVIIVPKGAAPRAVRML